MLEVSVVVVVISVLAATLLQRLSYVQEYAEKVAMELTVSHFQSALRFKVGELLIADRAIEISMLAGANPVDWMDRLPENYQGVLNSTPGTAEKGQWYFDEKRRELVYTVNSRRYFAPRENADYTVRFKVRPVLNADTATSEGEPVWVQLALINDYRWF